METRRSEIVRDSSTLLRALQFQAHGLFISGIYHLLFLDSANRNHTKQNCA